MAFQNKLDTQCIGILFRTDECQRAGGQKRTVLLNRFQSEKAGSPGEAPFHRASFVGSRLRGAALSTSLLFGGRMLEGIHNLCTYTRVTERHYLVESGAQRVSPNWEKTVVGEVCPFSCLLLSFYALRHLIMQPWLIYNFLGRPGWPHTHDDLSCTIIPRCVLTFLFDCLIYFGYFLQ